MRRVQLGLVAGSLCALVCVFLTGCGVVDRDDEPLAKKKDKGRGPGASIGPRAALKPVAGKYEGVISGVVKWEGKKPDLEALTAKLRGSMKSDPDYCLTGKKPGDTIAGPPFHDFEALQQSYRIGDNGNLGNVFVWIVPESGFAFDVPDSQLPAKKEVLISQPHCAFLPHCSVVFASRYKNGKQDPTGCQKMVVQNDARVSHNSNVQGGPLNNFPNVLLLSWDGKSKPADKVYELRPERDALSISCGIHGWMKAYVRAFDHPYAAVSSVGADLKDAKKPVWEDLSAKDFGTFEIKGVPIGAKVKLFAWHEELGHLLGATGKEITLGPKHEETIEAKLR
jgi:hypothetical protein